MDESSSELIEGACKFIDFTCGCCGLIWSSTFIEVYKVLDGEYLSCAKCKSSLRSTVGESRKIKYALARHALIWTFLVVCGLAGLLVIGAIFEWVNYLAGWVVLLVSVFLIGCVKVSYEGGKVFEVRLDSV